jgi:hypothetical protein
MAKKSPKEKPKREKPSARELFLRGASFERIKRAMSPESKKAVKFFLEHRHREWEMSEGPLPPSKNRPAPDDPSSEF